MGTATGYYIKFNNQLAPTDDVNIRKAIALSIDYDLVNSELHPGDPMSGPLAALFKDAFLDELEAPHMDLAKAADYVKQSKYAGGRIPLTLGYVAGSAYEEEISLMMQANLQSIGFDVKLQADPWSRITEIAAKPETTPNVNQIFFGPTYSSPLSVFITNIRLNRQDHGLLCRGLMTSKSISGSLRRVKNSIVTNVMLSTKRFSVTWWITKLMRSCKPHVTAWSSMTV
ncbi:ABC transporter substrate-binding protein [Vibrio olivae]